MCSKGVFSYPNHVPQGRWGVGVIISKPCVPRGGGYLCSQRIFLTWRTWLPHLPPPPNHEHTPVNLLCQTTEVRCQDESFSDIAMPLSLRIRCSPMHIFHWDKWPETRFHRREIEAPTPMQRHAHFLVFKPTIYLFQSYKKRKLTSRGTNPCWKLQKYSMESLCRVGEHSKACSFPGVFLSSLG